MWFMWGTYWKEVIEAISPTQDTTQTLSEAESINSSIPLTNAIRIIFPDTPNIIIDAIENKYWKDKKISLSSADSFDVTNLPSFLIGIGIDLKKDPIIITADEYLSVKDYWDINMLVVTRYSLGYIVMEQDRSRDYIEGYWGSYLFFSGIEKIPKELKDTNLETLSIRNSWKLGESLHIIKELTTLKELKLENNSLEEIDDDFFDNLTNLNSISFLWNNLTKLPNSIEKLDKLDYLNVSAMDNLWNEFTVTSKCKVHWLTDWRTNEKNNDWTTTYSPPDTSK